MLKKRIRDWVRAHRWYQQQGHAFSLEGRFRPNRGQEVEYLNGELPPPPNREPIDLWEAWDVELAWRQVSERSRWCLKYHYHPNVAGIIVHPAAACRLIRRHSYSKLELRANDWRDYMRIARKELEDELDSQLYGRHKAINVTQNVTENVTQYNRMQAGSCAY